MSQDAEVYDVIVIGAGLSGIAASRFYLDVHPESRVVVLERDASVGGPWGKSRMYPGFWSQSGIRMSGFSDIPLTVPKDAEVFNDIFEAKYVMDYLERYVDEHKYAGKTLRERIRLRSHVSKIQKKDSIWTVETESLSGEKSGQRTTFKSTKVIVATGATADPSMPKFEGEERFVGDIVHQKDYATFVARESTNAKKVAVLGAGKSAADIVYQQVKAGNEVRWVIRKSGGGPGAFTNPADNSRGPFLNDPELAATRFFATMSPSIFSQEGWWTRFLHRTYLGSLLLQGFWNSADQKCKRIGDFHHRPGALPGFEQLESEVKLFWATGPFGMIQRPDFWDTVAKNVHVHRADIQKLDHHGIVLKEKDAIQVDTIICATGFTNSFPFFDVSQRAALGLQHIPQLNDAENAWARLESEADKLVVEKYPILANPPNFPSTQTQTPNRLYNNIVPLSDSSIAFVGNIQVPNGFRAAEVQAVWTTALFDDVVKLPPKEEMQKTIAWVNAFSRRRYPTHGMAGNYLQYDMMAYIDRLLGEVGLTSHRKGWWEDWVHPLKAADLKGTTQEYLKKFGINKGLADENS